MSEKRGLGGLFDNSEILFFIILFLLLFWAVQDLHAIIQFANFSEF
ncbi:hypothetical protein [Pseudobacteroides cellulosolvens]|uniref:Uncharacterized protein n=1 Tax=Pseudobacteroides cellulosolvens ATCC 35603 = DSM 2933 TaxID=398512 RepID=A0A0L6JTZ9_9FIRM|nr:hypothetical protein [Pseudobacteroides cellulosolvens]KNY29283.1 hypothetical protein Bccel_4557 [Pseudobacteroides cellulosolvens ATCC 35603 = DSM 2933]